MKLVIPRGIIYHSVLQDIFYIFKCFFTPLTNEKKIQTFEQQFANYMGAKHALAFPYARTAIYYAIKAKKLPEGSEILMPPITIKPILDMVLACGLKPVFVDIHPDTLTFDIEKLKAAITPQTKSVLITYLFGMVPNLDEMISLCKEHQLFIMEDFSQCLNGKFKGKKVGTFGDVGIYSSSSIKTLDTYGGGLVVSDQDQLIAQMRKFQSELRPTKRIDLLKKIVTNLVRNVATTRYVFHFAVFPLIRMMTKKQEGSMIRHVGNRATSMLKNIPDEWFSKYTSLQADIGLKILPHIEAGDQERVQNVELVKSLAKGPAHRFPMGVQNSQNVYWQMMVYVSSAEKAQKFFQLNKVDTSTTSLVNISNLPSYPYQGHTPNAAEIHKNGLFLPAYPGLPKKDVQHIVQTLKSFSNDAQI